MKNKYNVKVENYIPLAYKIAGRYTGKGICIEDLRSASHIGLVRAAKYYDPSRGSFATVVHLTVRSEITNEFEKMSSKINLNNIKSYDIGIGDDRLTELETVDNGSHRVMEDILEHNDFMKKVLDALPQLQQRESYILKRRYLIGLIEEHRKSTGLYCTHQKLAEELGITHQRVQQLEARAFKKLREIIGDDYA
jgi:RNA polymerase sigma factor (sigma-70 family)